MEIIEPKPYVITNISFEIFLHTLKCNPMGLEHCIFLGAYHK